MMPVMENTPLYIPPSKQVKGLVVYCYLCKTNIVGGICKTSGKSIKQCQHGDKHVFKVYISVPGTKNERRTKTLETRDINEAIKLALDFEREVKENNYQRANSNGNKEGKSEKITVQKMPDNILNAMARYVGYLHNDPEIVTELRRKKRTGKHVADIEHNLKYFAICLTKNGHNPNTLAIRDIDDSIISEFKGYILKELKLSNSSYNRAITELISLYNYLIEKGCTNKNPFESIPRMPVNPNKETITEEEYNRLLEIIQKHELGKSILSNGVVKNMYKPWMKDAVEFGLLTGRRNEEIVQMKWNNIHEDERGNLLYIQAIDFKVSRQKGLEGNNQKPIYVPITDELKDLLFRMGYEIYKESDKYILAPEESMQRDTISKFMTHSFPHYYKLLGTDRNLSYKCLRKTYISRLSAFMGIDNARLITKHSGTQVMEEHYVDKKIIGHTAKNFKMFDQATENRQNEIEKVRSTNTEKILEL
jgi:integrase